ncbi:MAG: putative porin, partial [Prevotellaceae bacterium]|nr:putative porin [Prevotellaceae bacterium]
MLMALSAAALAQPDSVPVPNFAENMPLLDSAQAVDTALISLSDSAQMLTVVKKKERRLELPKTVETTEVDTSGASRVFRYTINHATNDVVLQEVDTSLFYYRTDYPFFRNDVGAIYLGNFGSPVLYYDFFKRKNDYDFIFQQPYEPYFFTPSNVSFYNTTTPYTILYYGWSGSKSQMEDQLRILHAQNIFNKFSFSLEYNNLGTKGQYARQHIKSRSFNLGLSYLGKYYKANLGYIFNDVEAQENGGIVDDKMILDTLVEPQMQQVRLQDAKNALNNSRIYLTHSLDLPLIYFGNDSVINNILMARFGHSLELSTYGKLYTDRADTVFYENNYLSKTATRDSLGLKNFDNKVFVQLRPLRAYIFESLAAGVGYKSMNTFMFDPGMYLTGATSRSKYTTYAYASMSAWYKQYFKWSAFAETNLNGYKSGDFKLGGDMTLSVYPIKGGVHLKAGVALTGNSPDFFIENYSTNHYRWTNNFGRDEELRLEAKLSIPSWRCEVGVSQSVHSNFIYFAGQEKNGKFGSDVFPVQHGEPLSITALTVNQNF